jgi:hypothetical protein
MALSHADFLEVMRVAGREGSLEEFNLISGNEHARYELYLEALALGLEEDERAVLAIILRESDLVMRRATLTEFVDRTASALRSPTAFRHWCRARAVSLCADPFVHARVDEWLTYMEIMAGEAVQPSRYLEASDWLQTKLGAEASTPEVLRGLAADGRTRRIRNRAARQ